MGYIIRHSRNIAPLADHITPSPAVTPASRLIDGKLSLPWIASGDDAYNIQFGSFSGGAALRFNAVAIFAYVAAAESGVDVEVALRGWRDSSAHDLIGQIDPNSPQSVSGVWAGEPMQAAISPSVTIRNRTDASHVTARLGEVVLGMREPIPSAKSLDYETIHPIIYNGDRAEVVGAPFKRIRVTFPPSRQPLRLPTEPVAWWPTESHEVHFGRFLAPHVSSRSDSDIHTMSATFEEMRGPYEP